MKQIGSTCVYPSWQGKKAPTWEFKPLILPQYYQYYFCYLYHHYFYYDYCHTVTIITTIIITIIIASDCIFLSCNVRVSESNLTL